MSAVGARVAVPAESSGAAAQDRIKRLALRLGQRSAVSLSKAVACSANYVGHLEGAVGSSLPVLLSCTKRDLFQRVDGGMEVTP